MFSGHFLLLVLLSTSVIFKQGVAQQCLLNFPNFNEGISTFSNSIHRQLLIPQYSFPCEATITRWEAHITGSVENLDSLDFQVWSLSPSGDKYTLKTRSSLDSGSVSYRNGSVVLELDPFKSRVAVEAGDVPGVFVRGAGVRIKFFDHFNVATYVYLVTDPPPVIVTNEEHYQNVAPLIWAQLEIDGVPVSTESGSILEQTTRVSEIKHNFTPNLTVTDSVNSSAGSTSTLSLQDSSVIIQSTATHPGTTYSGVSDQKNEDNHRFYLTVGIAVAVGMIILLCIFMFILLVVICIKLFKNRSKKCVSNEIQQSSPKINISRGHSSENCSLSFLPIDSTSRLNLMAFRHQEVACSSMGNVPDIIVESGGLYSTNLDDEPDSAMRVDIPSYSQSETVGEFANASIPIMRKLSDSCEPVNENPSYSYMVMHCANEDDAHIYDEIPLVGNYKPYEYEVPELSLPRTTRHHMTTISNGQKECLAEHEIPKSSMSSSSSPSLTQKRH